MIRKNQHVYDCSSLEGKGVDLNRNYEYKFGIDNSGSSNVECEEDYRGPNAFSEPETQAVRDFVVSHSLLKIAINFHAWGNLFITPFNYSNDRDASELKNNFPGAAAFYDDIWENGGVPSNSIKGSGILTVLYTANGEASDWMLKEHGVYGMSPELGISDKRSEEFFIIDSNILKQVLQDNYKWIEYTLAKLHP